MDIIILAGIYEKKLIFKEDIKNYLISTKCGSYGNYSRRTGKTPIYTIPIDNYVMLTVSIRITHYCYNENNYNNHQNIRLPNSINNRNAYNYMRE